MTTKEMPCEIDIDTLVLKSGSHAAESGEYCVLEAVACVAQERHSDHPKSVSPAIGAFMRAWNDALNDADRQRLKPYILKVIGTATTKADEERRAWMATDWLVRTFAPTWLDKALAPTVAILQNSAFDLLDRLIAVGKKDAVLA